MASYNKYHHNCYRDAIVIPLINCTTSVFAGIVVFSIIGFMSHESGIPIKDVITSGPGLAFIVYPEAISKLPLSPLWAVLFFTMLLAIGADTQFGMFETLVSALIDMWPSQLRQRKTSFTALISAIMFLLGLPFVTEVPLFCPSSAPAPLDWVRGWCRAGCTCSSSWTGTRPPSPSCSSASASASSSSTSTDRPASGRTSSS